MTHTTFIKSAFALVSISTLTTWLFLAYLLIDISEFQSDASQIMEDFKETANKAWARMIEDTKGKSMLELTMRDKRFIKRDKSGRRVLIVRRRQIATSQECNCCPNEQNEYGVNVNCPRGPPGADGSPGLNGEPGYNGDPGRDGIYGLDLGVNSHQECIICPVGPPGVPGQDGVMGNPGRQGAPGIHGLPGRGGLRGPAGPPGDPGMSAQPGRPGLPGRKGPPMVRLLSRPGPPGPRGPPGNQGVAGPDGETPRPGPPGPPGEAGSPGAPGMDGAPGYPGQMGMPGLPGSDAAYCSCPSRSLGVEGSSKYASLGEYARWSRLYDKARTKLS